IPIVFSNIGVAVEKGIVASLARPGGNVTGVTLQPDQLKLYQLLHEAVPKVARGVYFYDPESSRPNLAELLRSQAQALNIEWQSVAVRKGPNGITPTFAEVARATDGIVLPWDFPILANADQLCSLAAQQRLPTIGNGRRFAEAGCLMSYGEN